MWPLFHEDRKLGCAARLRVSEFDGVQVGYVLMTDSYESLDLFLNKLQLLSALVCGVIVSVECDEMHLERERCSNIVADRFGLIDSAKTI
jgi:hypothetical protein